MEAKVHYDIALTHKNPEQPSWLRRAVFLAAISVGAVYVYSVKNPDDFGRKSGSTVAWLSSLGAFLLSPLVSPKNEVSSRGVVVTVSD